MKAISQSRPVQITTPITNTKKLNDYIMKPLKAGFLGFATILMILFFLNLLSYVIGMNERFGMDVMDMMLAGVGFFLQLTGTLLKSFVR